MIEKIIIKGLFGNVDYTLDFKSLYSPDLLMISGPMGYGKSVILKMINGALNYQDYQKNASAELIFKQIPFSYFEVRDDKDYKVVVTKKENHSPIFMCDGLNLSAELYSYNDNQENQQIEGTVQEPYVKWHFSDGKGNLIEDYYHRMIEHSSQGAKHIFQLYDFLFNSKEDVLLIDTPEECLHVADIDGLNTHIQNLLDSTKKQIIIATHSPSIIDGRWNQTIDLYDITHNDKYDH